LAKGLRNAGFCEELIGYGHREGSLIRGVELGVIDSFTLDLAEAVERADIFVIATPTLVAAQLVTELIEQIGDRDDGPVVTDAASVKGNLQRAASAAGGYSRFVLGHPIAGSERSGVDAADANLYVNHRVILTPEPHNDADAVMLVRAMWTAVGADVVDMSVADHDAVLAATSHLPHVLAYALVDALAQSDASDDIFRFAAGGFRDFTRIASSDPVMWRDIALANREALLAAVDDFSEHLVLLRSAIEAGDGDRLHEIFTRAKQARDAFAQQLATRTGPDA
jgi:prephenate dehydrogenase